MVKRCVILHGAMRDKNKYNQYQRDYQRKYRKDIKFQTQVKQHAHTQYLKRKDKLSQYYRNKYLQTKIQVLEMLGGCFCSDCGCTILEILEINHIFGGGSMERKISKNTGITKLRQYLAKPTLSKNTLNVLCKVCNTKHYVQEILGVKGFQISFK